MDPTKTIDIKSPLSDRTAIHGRNVMALSATTLAVTIFPDINLTKLNIFGLTIGESVWIILAIVLAYYTVRFGVDCWVERSAWWGRWEGYAKQKPARLAKDAGTVESATGKGQLFDEARRENRRFLIFDFGLPLVMAISAGGVLIFKISIGS